MTGKQVSRPSAEQAARRLVVLKYVIVYALTAPPRDRLAKLLENWSVEDQEKFAADGEARRDQFWRPLQRMGLWEDVSPTERELARSTIVTMTSGQQVNATWRIESAVVLMWALGVIRHLPPYDIPASHDLLKEIPSNDDARRFVSSACLREESEIDRARSDAEWWHWRSRTRQLVEEGREFPADERTRAAGFSTYDDVVRFTAKKLAKEGRMVPIAEDFPARGKAYRELSAEEWAEVRSITIERHFALNWLSGYAPYNRWDETPTDT